MTMLACDNAGMTAARVSIQTQDFDLSAEIAALRAGDARVGAVCSFVGTVRDRNEGDAVSSMELEHYPGMTEKSIEAIIDKAVERFGIFGARVKAAPAKAKPKPAAKTSKRKTES